MIAALIITQICLFAGLYAVYRIEKRRFFNFLRKNLDPEQPSQIYGVTDVIAKQVAQSALSSLKMGGLNKNSQEVRQNRAADAAIVKDMISINNPGLGALISMLPSAEKLVNKNPQMAAIIAQKLSGLMAGGGNGENTKVTSISHNLTV